MSSETRFREGLERPEVALSIDMSSDSRTLLIAFGGMVGRIGMPPFEFFALTGELPIKRLFVRDLRQAWYHRGIPGYGDTLADCAESLRRLIGDHDVDRVLTTGNSAGGYAALVFGALLGAETVLCFAPKPSSTATLWPRWTITAGTIVWPSWPLRARWTSAGATSVARWPVPVARTLAIASTSTTRLRPIACTRSACVRSPACSSTVLATAVTASRVRYVTPALGEGAARGFGR